jgi:nitrate reductase molybdenum cofactor assembly chaperone NarJ/NarW
MRYTLKVLSALLAYPTLELQQAIPVLRLALAREDVLPAKARDRLDRIMEEIATGDLYDNQERYVFLFDRTRSLSLHVFEHVHGESRDRGQAMVDLAALYATNGFHSTASELPDYLPLFLEFLSLIPQAEAQGLISETAHVLEAIHQRLKKRKTPYSSVFSAVLALAHAPASRDVATMIAAEPLEDPNDLAALDRVWMDQEVRFGPTATDCGKDGLATKLRAANRPAPGMPSATPKRTVVTTNSHPSE